MDLRRIRYFTGIVDSGSPTGAGGRLYQRGKVILTQMEDLRQDLPLRHLALLTRDGRRLEQAWSVTKTPPAAGAAGGLSRVFVGAAFSGWRPLRRPGRSATGRTGRRRLPFPFPPPPSGR